MPVITNDTLARTGGHMATTDSIKEIPPVAQVDNTVPPKNGTRVATAAEHLASPPAPAYSAGSMTPAQPAMVSTQAVPVSPAATGLKPASTGYPAMVSTQALPQSVSTPARPPQP